ncbi:fibronectin type 3 domain containing protein [Grosmannia clavigera kw1407]|uniref:Fibronectin type 3 domain containing protein n=1 Tax=Grosmannia clavigera (strain kw1407 / UAMH 11150) TaxID=655863 RepID=F0XDG2_GROCL|nr:fibronectin type 3 domain containing protein [Grosmannia clavigera kw1407]EFX03446.1 fibronectin type 3 domain containing protein [Grosmannia clavigera kw1407]
MLWVTWTIPPLVSSLVLCFAVLVIWAADPKVTHLNLLSVLVLVLLGLSLAPDRASDVFNALYRLSITLIDDWRLDGLTLTHANMLVSGAAVVWLARRALQTLWKPVPELIDILGVEVPVPPDVSLTAIGSDKATITWTHPPPNRPVEKYVIQVNGVNVGESTTSRDNLITVSGLKANHFYNVRIIAVGSNNFQAGSRVLRLRTFASNGQPRLGTARLPTDFSDNDTPSRQSDAAGGDENGSAKQFVTSTFGIAQPLPQDTAQGLTRDGNLSAGINHSSRRNTVNRRHSPSTASLDQQSAMSVAGPGSNEETKLTEAQMAELNQKYLNLRKETEEITALMAKEEEDSKKLMSEYEAQKRAKRKEHKRKEEQTEKLKREQGSTERAMRAALQRRAQKEKKLKEKVAELQRLRDNIAKWDKGIQEMRRDQAKYNEQRAELEEEQQKKTTELRESTAEAQAECSRLEAELKEKRQRVKELEDDRDNQTNNGDGVAWRASLSELHKEWQRSELEYRNRLLHETRRQQGLDGHISILSAQMQQIPHNYVGPYSPFNPAGPAATLGASTNVPPGFDFDSMSQAQLKHRSRASNSISSVAISSPPQAYTLADLNGPITSTASPYISASRPSTQSGFLTGPYMGLATEHHLMMDESGFRALTAGAPLSPSATSLLPSNIFADDDASDPADLVHRMGPFVPVHTESPDPLGSHDGSGNNNGSDLANGNSSSNGSSNDNVISTNTNDPQSPASSSRSMSILSSPRDSSQHLPFSVYGVDSTDGRPPQSGRLPSPTMPAVHGQAPAHPRFGIFTFPRSRGARALDGDGPALGSLKHGQSQSFPRQGEDAELGNKSRRISLSSWSVFNRNSAGPEIMDSQFSAGAGMIKPGFSARSLFPFASRTNSSIFADRDASSPRPASVASTDMPRPSTDSGSIWGPPGLEGGGGSLSKSSRLWPSETAWPSRNPSRRPSIHGSPSALKTNLASAEDEILDEEELLNPETSPSQVGVIGSRPPAADKKASSLGKALNPAAPTFMASIFRTKSERGKDKVKDKTRSRDKDRDRDETAAPETPSLAIEETQPSKRLSRDGHSLRTQTSVSESRESLDYTISNTASEPNSVAVLSSSKDSSEHTLLKLFKKESTSKLSFSRRMRPSKGPGSMTNSEKNTSASRSSFGDFEDVNDELDRAGSVSGRGGSVLGPESVTGGSPCPSLGPTKSREKAESKLKTSGSWFSIKKKNREKESLEMDRDRLMETESVSSFAPTEDGEKRAV